MNFMRRFSMIAAIAASFASTISAEIPQGYYDSCEGKTGEALLKALYSTISSHTNVGYDGLWDVYKQSDVRADGTLWDIYTTKNWSSNFTKCGNYKNIGDCVNREHSVPKSVWGGGKDTQYSDAFHLYPTDGKVNGQRSSFPYGECANGTRLPNNGTVKALGKLGSCTFSGYSGEVFEPDDQYKGDLARSYFYMAACYNDRIYKWTQGNAAPMFSGDSYPVFKSWYKNLLLKWTRQDEVSQKEIDRNEAIYAHQKNRNPFIDHPELAEYIWGDKVGTPWYPGASADEPDILQPVQNVAIDLGIGAVGKAITKTVTVKTKAIEGNVILAAYSGFSVTPSYLTAAQANQGYNVTVSYTGSKAGTFTGALGISADDLEREVELKAQVMDGLPVYDATDITSDEFTVRWVYLNDATYYTLSVMQNGQSIPGYPRQVTASAQSYTVTGLDPLTTYTYTLSSSTISSATKTVTTADLVPYIEVLFDGTLAFATIPGTPSDVAELLLETENIADDIVITVHSPFEVSTDKSSWSTSVTLMPEEDRFYMRLNGNAEGSYETPIIVTAGTYTNDNAEATGTIADASATAFLEDWEEVVDPTTSVNCYSDKTFQGTACRWTVSDGGFGTDPNDTNFNQSVTLRMGKDTTSSIAMADDKQQGLGTVVFDAAKWGSDADAAINVEYSSDQGSTWTSAGQVTLDSSTCTAYSITINKTGNGRIRFRQSSGKRWFIDNISISDYTELGAVNELEYHSWDAYCRDSKLILECRDKSAEIAAHGIDGITWVNRTFAPGTHSIDLPKGMYIVVSDDFVRRVLIK